MGEKQRFDTQGEGAQYAPPLTVPPLHYAMGEKQRLDTQRCGAELHYTMMLQHRHVA